MYYDLKYVTYIMIGHIDNSLLLCCVKHQSFLKKLQQTLISLDETQTLDKTQLQQNSANES